MGGTFRPTHGRAAHDGAGGGVGVGRISMADEAPTAMRPELAPCELEDDSDADDGNRRLPDWFRLPVACPPTRVGDMLQATP
jgi:hypothetical protein